jgi:4-carboxymuconolactone decarboxylase
VDAVRVGPPAWLQGAAEPPPGLVRRLLHAVLVRAMRALGRRQVPNVFLTLLRVPRVLVPWSWYASRLMPYGRLEPLWRERMILRIAWNCRCRYEWLQHLEIGYRVGLSPDEALRVTQGPEAEPDPRVGALLRACDEVNADRRVADATYRELAGFLTEPLVLEALFVIGHYESLAGILNSTGILPEDEVLEAVGGQKACENLT